MFVLGLEKIERVVLLIWVTIVVKKTPNFFSIFFTPVCECVKFCMRLFWVGDIWTRFHDSVMSRRVDSNSSAPCWLLSFIFPSSLQQIYAATICAG